MAYFEQRRAVTDTEGLVFADEESGVIDLD